MPNRRDVLVGVAAAAIASTSKLSAQVSPDITMEDSPLPNALDVYYESLMDLCQPNGFGRDDKLVLNNTITSFDISKDTPYFNDGLYRRFADRVYQTSPDQASPASQADRFSYIYERLLKTAADQVDQRHPEIRPKILELNGAIEKRTLALTNLIAKLEKQWSIVAQQRGIKLGDPTYDLQQIKFFELQKYASQVSSYSDDIGSLIIRKEQVQRAVYSPAESLLLSTVSEMGASKKIARPLRPSFERSVPNVNDLTFADSRTTPESICDISLSLYPLGDLVKFLGISGQRQPINITKSSNVTQHHDVAWGAKARGRASFFGIKVGGGGGGSGQSSFTETIKKTEGLSISFDNIDEVLADRGYWFNPALFDNPELQKIFYKLPDTQRLRYVAVSLIICRGLSLSLTSTDSFDSNIWSKTSISGKGGVSFMGYGFGGGGSRTTNDYTIAISGDGKTITFKDDPSLVRLVAVRLVDAARPLPVIAPGTFSTLTNVPGPFATIDRANKGLNEPESRFRSDSLLRAFKEGKVSYRNLTSGR